MTSSESTTKAMPSRRHRGALLISVLLLSACGITYELLIGAIASYLLGSSVLQFSLTIGVFLASMGVGAYISRWIGDDLLERFIEVEIALAAVGGASGPLLFVAFTFTGSYYLVMFLLIIMVGALIGLEIPLLTRYLERYSSLRDSIANVFSLDYLGSLLASFLFPLVFLPHLGIFRTSLAVGLLNLLIALATLLFFWPILRRRLRPLLFALGVAVALAVTLGFGTTLSKAMESRLYRDEILYAKQSPYQRLVLTRYRDDVRLYLNGSLQFSSRDEYRYHEALVLPALSAAATRNRVLVIGGGDGLVVRQVLKAPGVKHIVLVDIDPEVTRLAREHPLLRKINNNCLEDKRVKIIHTDAFRYLDEESALFDVIVVDLPDPQREVLSKLYSIAFYRAIKRHLTPGGVAVTQATSPLFARKAYWCVVASVQAAGLQPLPYHTYVPSFGQWGFIMMAPRRIRGEQLQVPFPSRSLDDGAMTRMTSFPVDYGPIEVRANTLDRPVIIEYYREGWDAWF
ncbi:MAG: polyamine aminopropyltransferase [Deltaproteobacteria bacterium]|nr:polyamine aminopropyltransferase [Deltaproteobacteria bacterium]